MKTAVTILEYLSKYIVPIAFVAMLSAGGALMNVYGTVGKTCVVVSGIAQEVSRVDTQHNSRILANQISIDQVNKKASALELLLPQVLEGIKGIRSDIRIMKEEMNSMGRDVAVVKDREQRERATKVKVIE